MRFLLLYKNFFDKISNFKYINLIYISLLLILFFLPFYSQICLINNFSFGSISVFSSFKDNILLHFDTQKYISILGYDISIELIQERKVYIKPFFITELIFVILLCIAIVYLLFSIKKRQKLNYILFNFLLTYYFTYISTFSLISIINYKGLPEKFILLVGFYLAFIFLILAGIYFVLSLYFYHYPDKVDKYSHKSNKTPRPHKPTKSERIAELERQVKELQSKD